MCDREHAWCQGTHMCGGAGVHVRWILGFCPGGCCCECEQKLVTAHGYRLVGRVGVMCVICCKSLCTPQGAIQEAEATMSLRSFYTM